MNQSTIQSRTTMSYAFEAALQPFLTQPAASAPPLAHVIADAIRNGFRTRRTWTVSKRAPDSRRSRR